ncbi:MAG: GIY-YIG nuclease family protein [Phycisphaerales bacterium]|nr:GIY-YIG nuclease family protein [Phycisphaerales bacterium]
MPRSAGGYRFVSVDGGSIDYIGITSNLYSRLSQHRSTKPYGDPERHRVEYQVARTDHDWAQLCGWEAEKIGVHRPSLNATRGRNGRVASVYLQNKEIPVAVNESIEDAAARRGLLGLVLGLFRR